MILLACAVLQAKPLLHKHPPPDRSTRTYLSARVVGRDEGELEVGDGQNAGRPLLQVADGREHENALRFGDEYLAG